MHVYLLYHKTAPYYALYSRNSVGRPTQDWGNEKPICTSVYLFNFTTNSKLAKGKHNNGTPGFFFSLCVSIHLSYDSSLQQIYDIYAVSIPWKSTIGMIEDGSRIVSCVLDTAPYKGVCTYTCQLF